MKLTRGGRSFTCSFHDAQHCTSCKKIPMFFCTSNGQKYLWKDGGIQSQFLSPCPKQIRQSNFLPGGTPRKANHHPSTDQTSMTFCVQVKIRVNLLKPDLISPSSFSYWHQIPNNLQHPCNCVDTCCPHWLSIFCVRYLNPRTCLPRILPLWDYKHYETVETKSCCDFGTNRPGCFISVNSEASVES